MKIKDLHIHIFFKNEEFGGVFSINSLGRNNFIYGRSLGFCSIFLLRENNIRKVNIFRNNNLSVYNNNNVIRYNRTYIAGFHTQNNLNDIGTFNNDYAITDICVKEDSENKGYILT